MGFFDHDDSDDRQAYEQIQGSQPNEAHFSMCPRVHPLPCCT